MYKYLCFFLLISFLVSGQSLTGIVSDTIKNPLESANIIAKPLQENAGIKFSITDNKGRYKLELEKEVRYEIRVSYIGYLDEVLIYESNSNLTTHNFTLKTSGINLKEVIINHKYEPIVVKKDTLVYTVSAFTNGTERKLKEQLQKLPGVEVDKDGNVTVQGKKVTKFLVEDKPFFGGGTKLGVENIPADAVEKVEVIDHFNEVDFLKNVSDSDELAMNIKLKEGKKKFIFGDVEAGKGNDDYALLHAALFYYSPKTNVSYIGDYNNIGKSTFTFSDLMRFQGGVSSFISGRQSLSNLYSFTSDDKDVIKNESLFSALNFSQEFKKKLTLSGYGIFSNLLKKTEGLTAIDYLQTNVFESRSQKGKNKTILGIANVKMEYQTNAKERWYYNAQYQASTNDASTNLLSITNMNLSTFETLNAADNTSFKHFVEWHKSYSKEHTTTFVLNQAFEQSKPINQWFTNQSFLAGLIPIVNDASYNIQQINKIRAFNTDLLFKHYWIVNDFNHLYTNIGNNYGQTTVNTSEQQLLTDGTTNNFNENGFGNAVDYQLNDVFVGLEYKFKIGKWIGRPGLYLHYFHLKTSQPDANQTLDKVLFQPQFSSEIEFNKSESLNFDYKLVNDFAEANQMANRFTLQSFNSVFKGNALLENERFHNASLRYRKSSMFRGLMLNASVTFNKKVKTLRNEVELDGINQFTTPILTNNPETNWRFYGSLNKKIYRFNFRLNTSLSWFEYIQVLNNVENTNNRANQKVGLEVRTVYRKWPFVRVGYDKGFNSFSGITSSKFETEEWNASFEKDFFKKFIVKFDYESLKNETDTGTSNFFELANFSIGYQKENKPFGFEASVSNIFDTNQKNFNSFSDFLISEQTVFILPRIFMFTIRYKL